MATDSTGSPVEVGSAISASTAIITGVPYIKFIQWYKPTTVGHLCALQDGAGRTILKLYCEVANESIWAPIWGKYRDVYCDDLDSGTLYIYVR